MRLMGILGLAWLSSTPTLAQPPTTVVPTTPTVAQTPTDEDLAFGLLATYRNGDRSLQRVDPDIAFAWASASPDPRLPRGPFTAEWRGQLLLRQRTEHTFSAYVQGQVAVEVNGKTVLDARRDTPGWVTGKPVMLDFGETPLRVSFRKTQPAAQLSLFWSSSVFPIEPLPSQLLLHERTPAQPAAIERGRSAFTAYRCNRCHVRQQDLRAAAGPDLTAIGLGIQRDWLVRMLRNPRGQSAHARMPDFAFTQTESQAVAAFLTSGTEPRRLPQLKKTKETDRQEGQLLLHGLGCLACHQHGPLGTASPHSGGDLSHIGSKRSAEWLQEWLRDPASLNRDHRMPVFSLTETERRQLAVALAALRDPSQAAAAPSAARPPQADQIALGRQLVEAARCAACHRIPQITAAKTQLPDLANVNGIDWSRSCVGQQPNRRVRQPKFPAKIAADIRAYVQSRGGALSAPSAFDRGRSLMERSNCLACHPRGTGQGFAEWSGKIAASVPGLARQSESMIPPSLTAIGDKLVDAALRASVTGSPSEQRLPWLRIRMPRFRHSAEELDDILTYLIAHDRIPAQAAATPRPTVARDARLLAGHNLVGARGLNCVACHQIGKFQPRNVALGTRGSELLMPGKRLRQEYFLRWTRSPLRIVPGMEMPSYLKSVPGVLDGNIDTQLSAIWDALNDPNFTVPTSPSAVEQFLVTRAGDPARIVRDVLTHPNPAPHNFTSRPLAVGLENGHTLVLDMDTFCVRQWLLGDMARQRTEGKSWYWDAAGVALMSDFPLSPDVLVYRGGQTEPIAPRLRQGRRGRLLGYARRGLGIAWSYALQFEPSAAQPSAASSPMEVVVRETLQPVTVDDRTGVERTLSVDLPAGWSAQFARTKAVSVLGQAGIAYLGDAGWSPLVSGEPPAAATAGIPIPRRTPLRIRYLARLQSAKLDPKPGPKPPRQPVQSVTSVPGFEGTQLALDRSIMPTAMTWTAAGHLAFTSLKGHVYLAKDTNGDGLPDALSLFEEGLAAPFGILADGSDLIVAHKPEVLRLRDTDGDGRADQRSIIASGWGYTNNYHDWTCGIVRDTRGNLYVGLGSDYGQPKRPRDRARWRGAVLRITPSGNTEPVGFSFRYPVGLAITEDDQIFVSDNQGVQNTFNEINHLQIGRHYGVPSRYETQRDAAATPPAVQIPHPWTRSVNGLVFLPSGARFAAIGGHGIGCEYDSRFLIRFSLQRVGDVFQGATYYFSDPTAKVKSSNFEGPICAAVSPQGDLYIGSIHDSGWLGGRNTGSIVRLRRRESQPNGIRELRATAEGFEIEFFRAVDARAASRPESYSVSAYTRNWKGSYSTPDADRHKPVIESLTLSSDRRTVRLRIPRRRTGFVYEVRCGDIGTTEQPRLWPTTGHYTLHAIPQASTR